MHRLKPDFNQFIGRKLIKGDEQMGGFFNNEPIGELHESTGKHDK